MRNIYIAKLHDLSCKMAKNNLKKLFGLVTVLLIFIILSLNSYGIFKITDTSTGGTVETTSDYQACPSLSDFETY